MAAIVNFTKAAAFVQTILSQIEKVQAEPPSPQRNHNFEQLKATLVFACEEMDAYYTALRTSPAWDSEESRLCTKEYEDLSNKVTAIRKQKTDTETKESKTIDQAENKGIKPEVAGPSGVQDRKIPTTPAQSNDEVQIVNTVSGKKLDFPTLSGDYEEDQMTAGEWVRSVNICQSIGRWSDRNTAIQAVQALRGKVLKWARCLELEEDPNLKSWTLLSKAIETRFDPGRTEAETQAISKDCQQAPNELVQDFYDRMKHIHLIMNKKLREEAVKQKEVTYFDKWQKQQLKLAFLYGIQTSVRERLMNLGVIDQPIEELIKVARRLEISARVATGIKNVPPVVTEVQATEASKDGSTETKDMMQQIEQLTAEVAAFNLKFDKKQQSSNTPRRNNRNRFRPTFNNINHQGQVLTCFYCQRPGHIIRDCRTRIRDNYNIQGKQYEVALALELGPPRKIVTLTLVHRSTQVTFLYDTGAEVSLISMELLRKVDPGAILEEAPPFSPTNATGQPIRILGTYHRAWRFTGRTESFSLLVVPHLPSQAILGLDGIQKLKINYDANTHTVHQISALNHDNGKNSNHQEFQLLNQLKTEHLHPESIKQLKTLIIRHQDIFSQNEYDLGSCPFATHKIHLKNHTPIFSKQFRIPDQHRNYIIDHTKQLLQNDIVEPSFSRYNSPIFCVPKKPNKLRVVVDYRKINENSELDLYSGPTVDDCIDAIGRAQSKCFSTIDLTSGFHQIPLDFESRDPTTFTIPSVGSFRYKRAPFGLLGCPATFSRLMQNVISGLPNVEAYLDDVLVHTANASENIKLLEELFNRIRKYGLKLNLGKCIFLADEVEYLGYKIGPQGVKPGSDKAEVIRMAPSPSSVKEIQSFLGLANYFRRLIPHFSSITRPLTKLTSKDSGYISGKLPPEAENSFQELKAKLINEPCIGIPDPSKPFWLYVDAATGDCDGKIDGGLGAALVQPGPKGPQVVGYASRTLKDHERNYTPYLLEMAAAVFGIEAFSIHLTGRHFWLYTDHKPLETLTKRQTRTLQRLQQLMLEYSFEVVYTPGKDNVLGDWASRHYGRINSSSTKELPEVGQVNITDWEKLQRQDSGLEAIRDKINQRICDNTSNNDKPIQITNNILTYKFHDRTLIIPPANIRKEILTAAHGRKLAAHYGHERTKQRIMQNYWWPRMDIDIKSHIETCDPCQKGINPNTVLPTPLQPLPQENSPNKRVHLDLFGPLISDQTYKYICVCTDSFSKFTMIWPLTNKTAEQVADTFLKNWVCLIGCPEKIVTDGGKEFCNSVLSQLLKGLEIQHTHTTAYHPQANSQAETYNKTIIQAIRKMLPIDSTQWTQLLPFIMISHNSAVHSSTKVTPMELFFTFPPRLPPFNPASTYSNNYGDELLNRLYRTYQTANENNSARRDQYTKHFNRKSDNRIFQDNQKVLVYSPFKYTHLKSKKLQLPYAGPFIIQQSKPENKVYFVKREGVRRGFWANADRLLPYTDSGPHTFNMTTTPTMDFQPQAPPDNNGQPFNEALRPMQYPRTPTAPPPYRLTPRFPRLSPMSTPMRPFSPFTPRFTTPQTSFPPRQTIRPPTYPATPPTLDMSEFSPHPSPTPAAQTPSPQKTGQSLKTFTKTLLQQMKPTKTPKLQTGKVESPLDKENATNPEGRSRRYSDPTTTSDEGAPEHRYNLRRNPKPRDILDL